MDFLFGKNVFLKTKTMRFPSPLILEMGQAFLRDYTEKFNHIKIRLTYNTIKLNSQSLVLLSINPFRCCEWGCGVGVAIRVRMSGSCRVKS